MIFDFDEIISRENTNSIKYDLREQYFGTNKVQPLWVADMDFPSPPFIREAIIERANHPVFGYSFHPSSFYETIANWMNKQFNFKIKPDWVSFSPGVVPALNLCVLAYSQPGDGIIVQPPVYYPFFTAIKNHNRKIIYNQLVEKENGYCIDFDEFDKKASVASMFILCHPHNPVGRVWNEEELSTILKICLKHKLTIISDEIHSDIILNGNKHTPFARLGEDAASISVTCIAPSKTFNLAGLSTSAVIIPDKTLKARYEKILNGMHIGSGNIFGTIALEAAYRYGSDWLSELMTYIQENLKFLNNFTDNKLPELKIFQPEATYLVWIDFRKLGLTQAELNNFLINEAGLGLNDGQKFGPGGKGFQRMNIALPQKKLNEALLKLEKAMDRFRK